MTRNILGFCFYLVLIISFALYNNIMDCRIKKSFPNGVVIWFFPYGHK